MYENHLHLTVLTEEQLIELAKIVEYKIENKDYDYRHNELIDKYLSLMWMLNQRCQDQSGVQSTGKHLLINTNTARRRNGARIVQNFRRCIGCSVTARRS
jgi:hypothetical protein